MSDGSLSQDEIDALLSGSGGMDFEESSAAAGGEADISGLQSVVNETIDTQAANLSSLTSKSVSMDPPTVQVTDKESFLSMLSDEVVQVRLGFTDGLAADHGYVVSIDGAIAIAASMMGLDGVEIDDASINALQEALSNIAGPVSTSIGNRTGSTIMNEAPEGQQTPKAMVQLPGGQFAAVTYTVNMESTTIQLYEYFGMPVVTALAPPAEQQPAAMMGGQNQMGGQMGMGQMGQMNQMGGQMGMGQMGQMNQMGGQMGMGQMMGGQMGMQQGGLSVQSVGFPSLQQGPAQHENGNISLLMDVYMEMTVELGRTRKLIREILGMGEGTIIELDKLAGEPVDILVNHKLIAKGEVVVIDENFGVRVTEIVPPLERMNNIT